MGFCHRCGATLDAPSLDCASCGTTLGARPSTAAATNEPRLPPVTAEEARPGRPVGVALMAILVLIGATLGAMGGFLGVVLGIPLGVTVFADVGVGADASWPLLLAVALVMLGMGALGILLGTGMLKGRKRAWFGFLSFALWNVARDAAAVLDQDDGGAVGLVLWGFAGLYFLLPRVRAWFGMGPDAGRATVWTG